MFGLIWLTLRLACDNMTSSLVKRWKAASVSSKGVGQGRLRQKTGLMRFDYPISVKSTTQGPGWLGTGVMTSPISIKMLPSRRSCDGIMHTAYLQTHTHHITSSEIHRCLSLSNSRSVWVAKHRPCTVWAIPMDLGREDCLDKSRVSVQKRRDENSEHLEFPTPKSCACDFAYEHVKVPQWTLVLRSFLCWILLKHKYD